MLLVRTPRRSLTQRMRRQQTTSTGTARRRTGTNWAVVLPPSTFEAVTS